MSIPAYSTATYIPMFFGKPGPFNPASLGGLSKYVAYPGSYPGSRGAQPGGFPGISPPVTNSTQQGNSNVAPLGEASQIPLDREVLRRVFPASSTFNDIYVMTGQNINDPTGPTARWAQTPFRIAMNAGDLYSRQYMPGGSNQVKGSVGIGKYKNTRGASQGGGVKTGNGASGNQHYVYDSSVYTKYKRLANKNKTYNDISFGGSNNGAYVSLLASKRY
jgi:hypothetical protein